MTETRRNFDPYLTTQPGPLIRPAMELGWWKRDENGKKYQVRLRLFGKRLRWSCKRERFEPWEAYGTPTPEDWDQAVELAENRYQRRLIRKDTLDRVRRRGT